jgi:hypothetical protein
MKIQLQRLFLLFLVSACAALPYSAHAADSNAYLYIAHAAAGRNLSSTANPEYPVDISIGGHCVASGFSYGEIRGALTFPAGSYAAKVSVANSLNPCGGTAFYSATVTLAAGSVSMGIVSVNNAHQPTAQIFTVDLSAVGAGTSRVVVANTTSSNLTGTFTLGDSTASPISGNFPAGTVNAVGVPSNEYTAWVYPTGSSVLATGPIEFDLVSRNLYLVVLAGSTANNSVQIVGPQVIKNVL